jgi:hypothetical protein
MSVSKKKLFLFLIRHRRIVSGFPKQTVVRQGSLVFCICEAPKLAHTVGEKGRLGPAWRDRGGDVGPCNMFRRRTRANAVAGTE